MTPTEQIRRYFETHPAPHRGVVFDVVEYNDRMALRLYRDNFNEFPDGKQQDIVKWLETVLADLNFSNPFSVTVEMEGYAP